MLQRDLKLQAMSLATQLPDDEETARRVHAYLGYLIDNWLFGEKEGFAGKTLDSHSSCGSISLSADTKYKGNADVLP